MPRSKSREPGELDQTPTPAETSRAHVHKVESTRDKDRKRKKHDRKDDSHKHKRKKSSRTRSPNDKRRKMLSEDDDLNDIKVAEGSHHKALRDEPQSIIPKQEILHQEISKCRETTGEEAIISNPYHVARSKFDDEDEEEVEETQIIDDGNSEISLLDEVEDSSQNIIAEAEEKPVENVELITDNENEYEEKTPYLSDSYPREELPPYYPAIQGCRSAKDFHRLNRIGEGAYGVVSRAIDLKQRTIVALKKVKLGDNGFPATSLREIKILMTANHQNIVAIKEIVVDEKHVGEVDIVMEYIEHDMKCLMESMNNHFTIGQVKSLMQQLLTGVHYLHDNWIIHRDLKTSNLLLSNSGILKIADFGMARECSSSPKPYSPTVITLWYRCPELLLGAKVYNASVDMWSVGCIFGEFLSKKPPFMSKSEIEQINCIFKTLGIPTEAIWKGVSELEGMKNNALSKTNTYNLLKKKFEKYLRSDKGFDLMNGLLRYDPNKRMTAKEALEHQFFDEYPHAIHPSMFPTWPAKSQLDKVVKQLGRV